MCICSTKESGLFAPETSGGVFKSLGHKVHLEVLVRESEKETVQLREL